MATKAIFGLAALFGLAGVGLTRADMKSGCCVPGAACCSPSTGSHGPAGTDAAPAEAATSRVAVDGMTCAGCAKSVAKAVSAVEGVALATADVTTKSLTVVAKAGAAPSPKALWEAVEKAGYRPTRIEGAAGTYDSKPAK